MAKKKAESTRNNQKPGRNVNDVEISNTVKSSIVSDIDKDIPTTRVARQNTYVAIIANEHYHETPDVDYAINDGKSFQQYCEKTLGIPAKNIKVYNDATGGMIRRAIGWLAGIQNFDKKARLIFYYSGHGMPDENDKSAYVIPCDGWTKDLKSTCVSIKEIYEKLGKIQADCITVILDACFTGMQRGKEQAILAARGVAIKAKQETLSGNVVVFTAAADDETAMAFNEQRHGLFTYHLLNKLKEAKGNITYGELFEAVENEVKRESFLTNEKLQSPTHSVSASMKNRWKSMTF